MIAFSMRQSPNAHPGFAGFFVRINGCLRFVIIAPQGDDAVQFRARTDQHAQADDAVRDLGLVDNAPVGNHGVINLRAVDF